MRFIDYGTRSDRLMSPDLYSWDDVLDMVPPQATICSFFGAPVKIKDKTSFTIEELEGFTSLMKQSSPMKMKVHKIENELSVSLYAQAGQDILKELGHLPAFMEYFSTLPASLPGGLNFSQFDKNPSQLDLSSLSAKSLVSDMESLKSKIEAIFQGIKTEKEVVQNLEKKTEVLSDVCTSVVSMVKVGMVGLEAKLSEAEVRHSHITKLYKLLTIYFPDRSQFDW